MDKRIRTLLDPLYSLLTRLAGKSPAEVPVMMTREERIFHLIEKNGHGLEIGPSHNPVAPKKKGFDVQTLDHATAGELREKYKGLEAAGVHVENIEEVDFVWHGEPLRELVGRTGCYDWIISSHVIEHVPDLVTHLQECEILLKKGGVLSLVIPDKRYCFDYFLPATTTGQLLDAFADSRVRPSGGQVFDHFANAVKRNGSITWSQETTGGEFEPHYPFGEARKLWTQSRAEPGYIDVHCWRFTPATFRLILLDLRNLGLTELEIKAEFGTVGCEFYVSLGKEEGSRGNSDRFDALREIKNGNK